VEEAADLPGGGDLYCTPDALRWVFFDPETSPGTADHTLIATRSRAIALSLQARLYPAIEADADHAWSVRRFQKRVARPS